MSYSRSLLVVALALAIATVSADEASAKKLPPVKQPSAKQPSVKKGHHPFHGKVVHVHHNKTEKHTGSIAAKHHRHTADKVGDSTDVVVERKFHVSPSTTFERVDVYGKGKEAVRVVSKAHFRDVHKGRHVTIHHKGHHATDVKIIHHHAAKVN